MKWIRILLITSFLLGISGQNIYSMTQVKGWINQVRPGTFPEAMPAADAGTAKAKKRVFSEGDLKVLTALTQKEEELKRKDEEIRKKENELKNLEQQIERKLDQMRQLAQKLEGERKERKQLDEKDITKMVKLYESMDPENSSTFLNDMDRTTATHILMQMNPRKASALLQLLNPQVAVDITEMVTRFKQEQKP